MKPNLNNFYHRLLVEILRINKNNIVCIDVNYYVNLKIFYRQMGFLSHGYIVGSALARESAIKKLKRDFNHTDLESLLLNFDYELVKGKRYLLAKKIPTLDLY